MNTDVTELSFRADLLRESIRSKGLSQHKIAKLIGIDDKTFSQKMNGKTDWKLKEIQAINVILKPSDINSIFRL